MGKKIFLLVLVLLLVLIGLRIVGRIARPKITEEKEKTIPVIVANPVYGQIQEKLTLTGDIKGETEVAVRPKTVGRVEEIYVKEGDYVRAGAPLLSFVAGISPKDELYHDLVTQAPISGIVGVQNVKLGEQVTSGPTGFNPVFMIYRIDQVKVYVDVPEKNYSDIRPGMTAQINLDAFPNDKFTGKINNIRPVIDPMSRTTQVEIIIPNPGHKIKPGMFCRVNLITREKNKVLLIPADAVLGDAEKYVFTAEGKRAVKKVVMTGIQEDGRLEIASGLIEADRVITVGQRVVENDSPIEVKTND